MVTAKCSLHLLDPNLSLHKVSLKKTRSIAMFAIQARQSYSYDGNEVALSILSMTNEVSLSWLILRETYYCDPKAVVVVVVVVVVFTFKTVPISTQYLLTSVLVQLTRTPSVVTG